MPRKMVLTVAAAVVLSLAAPAAAVEAGDSGERARLDSSAATMTVDTKPSKQQVKRIKWRACSAKALEGLECGRYTVPRDWDEPNGDTYRLKVYRLKSQGNRSDVKGTLFLNPGGPGFGGVGYIGAIAQSNRLRENFHIATWDPRGVPNTEPLLNNCAGQVGGTDPLPATGPFTWRQMVASVNNALGPAAAYCYNNSLDWVEYIGTNNVVQDLDALRAAVGDKKLTYLGGSYGTTIGKVYAQRYPNRVRAVMLDGVTQPNLTVPDYAVDNGRGGREGFRYLQRNLPASVYTGYLALNDLLATNVITLAPGQVVTRFALWNLALLAARSPASIEDLTTSVCGLVAELGLPGCEDRIIAASDAAISRGFTKAGKTGPPNDMLTRLINCVDLRGRPSISQIAAGAGDNDTTAPAGQVGGTNGSNFGSMCRGLPGPADPLPAFDSKVRTSTPPLLLSGKYDVATPFTGAKQTRSWFPGSRLISVDTSFHVLFPAPTSCINKPVHRYLIKRKLPKQDFNCKYPFPMQ